MATYANLVKPEHMRRRKRMKTKQVASSSSDFSAPTRKGDWRDRYDVFGAFSQATRHSHVHGKKNGGC